MVTSNPYPHPGPSRENYSHNSIEQNKLKASCKGPKQWNNSQSKYYYNIVKLQNLSKIISKVKTDYLARVKNAM